MSTDARITASCPQCGEVELMAEHMWVVVTDPTERSHYGFRCPRCEAASRHPADLETLAVLAAIVPVEMLAIPLEALETPTGPPLTSDDLIDLMVALDALDADNLDALVPHPAAACETC
jgi:hypothetical protein